MTDTIVFIFSSGIALSGILLFVYGAWYGNTIFTILSVLLLIDALIVWRKLEYRLPRGE